MQNVSEDFKTAISEPSRELKSRITLPELTLDDDNIQIINLDSSLVFGEDFEIGTAPMDTIKIELIFSPEGYIEYDYEDKECDAQIGIKLYDDTVEYLSIGLFTVEEVIKNDYKITLNCVDRMYKAEKDFINNLMFPTTIIDILESACEQSDILLATTSFANADYVVPNEPVFDNITCRTIFAQVAELAGGYAVINRQGELEILTLGNIPVRNITKDHYIDFKRDEVGIGKIDRVIVKVGKETSEQGIGDNIYTIVDNMFVQDPNDVVGPLFNVLKDVSYNACKLKWQGDFSLDLGDKITIDGYETYILDRKSSYTGGLREDYSAPAKSNVERNSTGKSNILLDMNNIKTQIKVIEGEITQTIESIEGEVKNEVAEQMKTAEIYTWIRYADDENGNGISNNPAGKKYVGIATNKKNVEPSNTPDDYEWSLIKGDKGAQGEQGQDGQTTYTWIMYANDVLGNGISDASEDKRYVGIATNKLTQNKSVNPDDYEWSPLYDNVEIGGANRLYDSRANIEFSHGEWGRNLKVNSQRPDTFFNYSGTTGTKTFEEDLTNPSKGIAIFNITGNGGMIYTILKSVPLINELEKEYTVSFYIKASKDISIGSISINEGVVTNRVVSAVNTEYQKFIITFKITTLSGLNHNFHIPLSGNVAPFTLYMHSFKIEKGNKATDWTPAPEDVDGWLDTKLIRGPGNPYYKVVSPHADFTSLSVGFPNSRFAEPLESLGRVTVSLDVMVEVDREITINNSTFAASGNRWTRIFFTKEFTENNNTSTRVLTPYSRKRKVIRNISTNLIDELRTDINTLYYRNLQVEQGNVPTSYNLTPEELEGEITRSKTEIKQLKDSILLVATRNENTGRFEITPESIVQAIDTTDGVGRLKTVKVTVDEYGLTVDDGAIIIRDSRNTAIVTSDGLKAMYIFTSSGELNGWQPIGTWYNMLDAERKTATLNVYIPADLIIETAQLCTRSMPAYLTGHSSVANGFYHPRNLKLYEGEVTDGCIDWPAQSSYSIIFGRDGRTDITTQAWGSNWTPTGQGIKEKVADVKNNIIPGRGTVFMVETTDAPTETNSRYMGAMQLELVITGFLRG